MSEDNNPGKESLVYTPSKVTWATSEFIQKDKYNVDRYFIRFVFVFITGFILFSLLTEKSVVVPADGVVYPMNKPLVVSAPNQLRLKSINVEDGLTVKAGEVLVVGAGAIDKATIETIIRQKDLIESLVGKIVSKKCNENCYNSVKAIRDSFFTSKLSKSVSDDIYTYFLNIEKSIDSLKKTLDDFHFRQSQYEDLIHEKGVLERKLKSLVSSSYAQELKTEIENLKSRIVGINNRMRRVDKQLGDALGGVALTLKSNIATIESKLKTYNSKFFIRAPFESEVSLKRNLAVGQLVQPGEILFYLSDLNSNLRASLFISDKDIGEVKAGQVAKLDFTAFPAKYYGVMGCNIDSVSRQLIVSDESLKRNQNSFDVKCKLEKQGFEKNKQKFPLKSGMKFTAKVIIKHESFFDFLVKKILSLKSDTFEGLGL